MHAESADDLAREYGVVAVAALQGKSALVDDHPGIEGCAVADAGIVVYAGGRAALTSKGSGDGEIHARYGE